MGKVKQTISVIPSLFTLGNAFFGFFAIATAIEGNIEQAIFFIFLGNDMRRAGRLYREAF